MSGDLDTIEQALEAVAAMDADWYDIEHSDALPALARVRAALEAKDEALRASEAALALREEFIDRIGKRVNFETFQLSDDGVAFARAALSAHASSAADTGDGQ